MNDEELTGEIMCFLYVYKRIQTLGASSRNVCFLNIGGL